MGRLVVLGVAGFGAGWFVWSWAIVVSDLLLGLGRLVRGRLESAVFGAASCCGFESRRAGSSRAARGVKVQASLPPAHLPSELGVSIKAAAIISFGGCVSVCGPVFK